MRQGQAKGLREWANTQKLPIFAIGDYNFDCSFPAEVGNESFTMFMRGGVWK